MAKLSNKDLYWLAGILEGEGSFGMTRCCVSGRVYLYPLIQLGMSDEDVIKRVALLYGSAYYPVKPSRVGNKLRWRTTLTNQRAEALMRALYPIMSNRRQARIREVLQKCADRKARPHGKRGLYK
jgi:hypothetical protein